MALFRPRRYLYRRKLPHIQREAKPLFLNATTRERWVLPPPARDLVLDCLRQEHGKRAKFYIAVIMPDHLHMIFDLLPDAATNSIFSIAEVMSTLKGVTAHKINRLLRRRGAVWEEEFFDHYIRTRDELDAKFRYIQMNPVRAGIVGRPEGYPWLWIPSAS